MSLLNPEREQSDSETDSTENALLHHHGKPWQNAVIFGACHLKCPEVIFYHRRFLNKALPIIEGLRGEYINCI